MLALFRSKSIFLESRKITKPLEKRTWIERMKTNGLFKPSQKVRIDLPLLISCRQPGKTFLTITTFTTYFHKQYVSTAAKSQTPAVARPFPPFRLANARRTLASLEMRLSSCRSTVSYRTYLNCLFPVNIGFNCISLSNLKMMMSS